MNRQIYLSLPVLGLAALRLTVPALFFGLESLKLFPDSLPVVDPGHSALLPLRWLNAFVFLWFAFDNFESPLQFSNIGNLFLKKIGFPNPVSLIPVSYSMGVLELLVATSFLAGPFLDLASLMGSIIVFAVLFAFKVGNGTLLVRDVGILGATLTLLWLTI